MNDLEALVAKIPDWVKLSSTLYVPRVPGYRRVWYCTNRAVDDSKGFGANRFIGEIGVPVYGLCQVRVSQTRQRGEMIRKERHFLTGTTYIQLIELQSESAFSLEEVFWKMLQEQDRTTGRKSLLFVHGFNVSFQSAIERAAQLAEDLVISGEVFVFSWPSQASAVEYIADQDRAVKSRSELAAWIELILASMGAQRRHSLNIVAHSMGNRVLAPALGNLRNEIEASNVLGEVVLAAPDVDIDEMAEWLGAAAKSVRRLSVYVSETDLALLVSQRAHKTERAGTNPSGDERWDTIHCNGCGNDLFKHSYIFESPPVLSDFHALLDGRHCEERHMRAINTHSRIYRLLFQ